MVSLAFQSTHPRRVRPANTMTAGKTREFQSTHPRRVRRELPGPLPVQHGVSIHAPTQGATKSPTCRPRWRSCFNPRTHAGCDVHLVTKLRQASEVSIHAPTQGATPNGARGQIASFNPRTHAGCAPRLSSGVYKRVFQSTHPRRVRLAALSLCLALGCFNPRTHAGCDAELSTRQAPQACVQSTHPRRVRPSATTDDVVVFQVSIHAPTQGATVLSSNASDVRTCFNPRTHAGCDR